MVRFQQDSNLKRNPTQPRVKSLSVMFTPAICPTHGQEGFKEASQRTNGDGLQHGLEIGDVVQDASHKTIEGPTVPQQLLGRFDVLFLQSHSALHAMPIIPCEVLVKFSA